MKTCTDCKKSKPLSEFHKKSSSKDGHQGRCKPCNKAKVRQWQSDNPEKWEANWRRNSYGSEARLKKRARQYGLTADQLTDMLIDSDGKCTICHEPPRKWLVVDHCHNSGKVRGLLCEDCNFGLGAFRDNTEFMARAIEYLNDNREEQ